MPQTRDHALDCLGNDAPIPILAHWFLPFALNKILAVNARKSQRRRVCASAADKIVKVCAGERCVKPDILP